MRHRQKYKVSDAEESQRFSILSAIGFPITIEPLGFLITASAVFQQFVYYNLYINKACLNNYGFNYTTCFPNETVEDISENAINGSSYETDEVQRYVSILLIYDSLLENLPGVFMVLCLGPWSNRHGRRPLLCLFTAVFALSIVVAILNEYFEKWPAEYLLFAALTFGFSGGIGTYYMVTTRYIVDITTEEARTYRLSVFDGIRTFSIPVASLISSHLLRRSNKWAVWGFSLTLVTLALAYVIFFVKESAGKDVEKGKHNSTSDGSIVSVLKNFCICFRVTVKKREGFTRTCVLACIAILCLSQYSIAVRYNTYLYTRKKFGWDAADYALFSAISSTIPAIGGLLAIPSLSAFFGIRDGVLGIISILSIFTSNVMTAFANSTIMAYLATGPTIMESGIDIIAKSFISKLIIDSVELDYIFSVYASLVLVTPLTLSPISKLIYKTTLDTFPGCIFVVDAGVNVLMLILFIIVLRLRPEDRKEKTEIGSTTEIKKENTSTELSANPLEVRTVPVI